MWYVSYSAKKLNLNRRGRFNLSLSDTYSVYTFISMLQKTVGFLRKYGMFHFSYSGALMLQEQPGNQCARGVRHPGNMESTPIKTLQS